MNEIPRSCAWLDSCGGCTRRASALAVSTQLQAGEAVEGSTNINRQELVLMSEVLPNKAEVLTNEEGPYDYCTVNQDVSGQTGCDSYLATSSDKQPKVTPVGLLKNTLSSLIT